MVSWKRVDDELGRLKEWRLIVKGKSRDRCAAVVFANAVWHTFDKRGIGGENSAEENIRLAKLEAAGSAIEQGFI